MDALPFQKRKRIRDARAITEYKRRHLWCEGCAKARTDDVHHLVSKQMGGDDHADNFLALCRRCHRAWATINKTRGDWYAERAATMTTEARQKVERALRVSDD